MIRFTRRRWLLAGLCAPLGWTMSAPSLLIRREGESLRISAPQIRFLSGKPLEQLRNGASVSFASQITLSSESQSAILARVLDRFAISYDLWEEKFSATRLGPPRRTQSRLTVPAAEAWCLDQLLPIPSSLPPSKPFWIKLELRAEDPKELATVIGEPGINLTRLVEIFSRPPRSQQPRWIENAGPLRLQDLG